MQIGLFPGSFNPIHIGHLIIAEYMTNYHGLEEIWFVISPQNPLKRKATLADALDRVQMAQLAVSTNDKLKVSEVELDLPKPSYTIDTLDYVKSKWPKDQFSLIIGSDNYATLSKWKSHERLVKENQIFVYPRKTFPLGQEIPPPKIVFTEAPQIDISSTIIREAVKSGKSIRYMVPEPVREFILEKGLYR